MHKVLIAARDAKQGDMLCTGTLGHFVIEQVSQGEAGVTLHELNKAQSFHYGADDRVLVLRGSDRCAAGDEAAAIQADLAIARMKQSGRWDEIRFRDADRREFNELSSRLERNSMGLWA